MSTFFAASRGCFPNRLGRDGAHVNDDLSRTTALDDSLRPDDDFLHIGNRPDGDDDGASPPATRQVMPQLALQPPLAPASCPECDYRPSRETGFSQIEGHRLAHDPKTDKANLLHHFTPPVGMITSHLLTHSQSIFLSSFYFNDRILNDFPGRDILNLLGNYGKGVMQLPVASKKPYSTLFRGHSFVALFGPSTITNLDH